MGLDQESFVSPELVPTSLICPICAGVVENPVITASEHLFCESCLIEWLTKSSICPMTNCEISLDTVTTPGRLILSILSELLRKCPHAGCTWQGHSGQFLFHTKVCPLRPRDSILAELEQALLCNRELLTKIKSLERECLDAECARIELEHKNILMERKLKVFDAFFEGHDNPFGFVTKSAHSYPQSPIKTAVGMIRRSSVGGFDDLGNRVEGRFNLRMNSIVKSPSGMSGPGSRSPGWTDGMERNLSIHESEKIYGERERERDRDREKERYPLTIDVETDISGGGIALSCRSERGDGSSYLHRILRDKYSQDKSIRRGRGDSLGENGGDRVGIDMGGDRGRDRDRDVGGTEIDTTHDAIRDSLIREDSGRNGIGRDDWGVDIPTQIQIQGRGQGDDLGSSSRGRGSGRGSARYQNSPKAPSEKEDSTRIFVLLDEEEEGVQTVSEREERGGIVRIEMEKRESSKEIMTGGNLKSSSNSPPNGQIKN